MKKQIINLIESLGGTASYSGKDQYMYVSGRDNNHVQEIISIIYHDHPHLPFTIV